MNKYWLLAFVAWSVGMFIGGFKAESWRAGQAAAQIVEEQQKVTIAAEQGVIVKQQKAESITNNVEAQYEKQIFGIDSKYDFNGLRKPDDTTGHRLPTVSRTTVISNPDPKSSKTYQLTYRQCDIEEQKLISLWAWLYRQRQ
jgi:hypothetical protein